MITEGYLRRHIAAYDVNREIALLDVAQEYVLEYLRREGAFDTMLLFKGGTALRKFVFGDRGRFSVDLDFGLRDDEPSNAEFVLDLLDGCAYCGVAVRLERRKGPAALLRLDTSLGPVTVPSAVSIRTRSPWLPPQHRDPMAFEFLDRGLQPEFTRSSLPILDLREIAAEKIAAFWRRRKARDLYDLEYLGRALQVDFDGPGIARLALLKVYSDVTDDRSARPLTAPEDIFGLPAMSVAGLDDLGHFRAASVDVAELLARCARRYVALLHVEEEILRLATTCNQRDRFRALQLRNGVTGTLARPR